MPPAPLARAARLVTEGWAAVRDGTGRDVLRYVAYRARGLDFAPATPAELGLDPARAYGMANSGGVALERVLATLRPTPADGAIDLGCGKGSALVSLARFPFGRRAGIDLSPDLVRIARRNLRRLGLRDVQLAGADAGSFTGLDPFTLVYLFNPFPAPVVAQVMDNLARSLRRAPRALTIVYKNPLHEAEVLATGLFERRAVFLSGRFKPFVVYAACR